MEMFVLFNSTFTRVKINANFGSAVLHFISIHFSLAFSLVVKVFLTGCFVLSVKSRETKHIRHIYNSIISHGIYR